VDRSRLSLKIGCHSNGPWWIEKLTSDQFIYSRSSTNPENLAKIDPADVDMIGLREIVKNRYETKAEHKPDAEHSSSCLQGPAN